MKNKLTMTLCSCAALAAFTPSLHAATTLLNNPGANSTGASTLYDLAFSTGSTAYTLGAISLAPVLVRLDGMFISGESATGSLTMSLYAADTATHSRTGSALASETFSDIHYAGFYSESWPVVGRMFSTNFSLAADSEYVLAFTSGVDGAGFAITDTPLTGGTSGLTYLGGTSHYHSLTLTGNAVSSGTVSGGGTSAVPEASTSLGLLALGAGGILTRRRQKRKA